MKHFSCEVYPSHFADVKYFCLTGEVAKQIQMSLKTAAFINNSYYENEARSMPYAFGILYGNKPNHALNYILTGDGKNFTVKILEPQNGKIYKPADKKLDEIYLAIA